MNTITLNLNFSSLPPIVLRKRHTLILVKNTLGKFVLGQKKIYPDGISRLIGGGIEENEEPQNAAARELAEELQITVAAEELEPLVQIVANITYQSQHITFTTWVYFHQLKSDQIAPASDLNGVVYLTEAELRELASRYQALPRKLEDIIGFSWSDYGKLYGSIHQISLDSYLQLQQFHTN